MNVHEWRLGRRVERARRLASPEARSGHRKTHRRTVTINRGHILAISSPKTKLGWQKPEPGVICTRRVSISALLLATTIALSGCAATSTEHSSTPESGSTSATPSLTPTPTPTVETAIGAATTLKAAIPEVTQIVQITEANDSNKLIGRPTGYTDAAVIYDSRVSSSDLGVACGATIEIWPDSAAAEARKAYIQGILKDSPALGTEYDYVQGSAILRLTGELNPSVATSYEAAWKGLFG